MDTSDDSALLSLVYDFLLKKDATIAQVFQKKTKAVSSVFP